MKRIFVFFFMLMIGLPIDGQAQQHVVGCDLWPPYQYYEDDEMTGFSVEVMREVYALMDADIVSLQAYPWARALASLEDGKFDVLISGTYHVDRTAYALYPEEELVHSPWTIWSRTNLAVPSMNALKGRVVGVIIGYNYTPQFSKFIQDESTVVTLKTDEQCLVMLSRERLDFCAVELHNGHYLQKNLGVTNLAVHRDLVVKETGLYALFNKQTVRPEFVSRFSSTLTEFKKSPRYQELKAKYLDPGYQ